MKIISCMNIDEGLLHSFGAGVRTYKKREIIFKEEIRHNIIFRLSRER
jgi:hypothetical protein